MSGRMIVRRLSSLAEPLPRMTPGKYLVPNKGGYKKLMERQAQFCRDDGLMVWQKLPLDTVLYRGLWVAVSLGTLMTVDALRRLASPPKNA